MSPKSGKRLWDKDMRKNSGLIRRPKISSRNICMKYTPFIRGALSAVMFSMLAASPALAEKSASVLLPARMHRLLKR